jgi:Mn2+/Fe2+ NRAMP family transporter
LSANVAGGERDGNNRRGRHASQRHATQRRLDEAHIGDINGAFGTIHRGDHGPRHTWSARLRTLLAILGPGLIVMVGDNDAGAFSTYTQAGQDYGTTLLWTLMLLVPVLYVNQEMVLRLGAVSALLVMMAVSTGNFRRFERFAVFLVFGSLLLIPVTS